MQPKYGSLIEPSLDLSQVRRRRAIRSRTLVFVFDFSRLHDGSFARRNSLQAVIGGNDGPQDFLGVANILQPGLDVSRDIVWQDAPRSAARHQVQCRLALGAEFGPSSKYAPTAGSIKLDSADNQTDPLPARR
jgi:hypothetical protein